MSMDDCDAFYVWDQIFNSNNNKYLRRALIAKVRCLPFDKKERPFSGSFI